MDANYMELTSRIELITTVVFWLAVISFLLVAYQSIKKYTSIQRARNTFFIKYGFRRVADVEPETLLPTFSGDVHNERTLGNAVYIHGGDKTELSNIMVGTIDGVKSYFYDSRITDSLYSDNHATYSVLVFEIHFSRTFPNFILLSKNKSITLAPPKNFEKYEETTLEGNFSEYYTLMTRPQDLSDALTFLTPTTMQALLEHASRFDIEVREHKIFIFSYNAETESVFDEMYRFTKLIISHAQ